MREILVSQLNFIKYKYLKIKFKKMKKFGKSKTTTKNDYFISDILSGEDNFHEEQMSKKLKIANKTNNDDHYLFKKIYKEKENRSTNANTQKKNITNNIKTFSDFEENNLYNILNVDIKSDKELIKKNYKGLCMQHHPDKGGNATTFQTIQKAYKILTNDFYKRLYDNFSSDAMCIIDYLINNEHNVDMSNINQLEIDEIDLETFKVLVLMQNKYK